MLLFNVMLMINNSFNYFRKRLIINGWVGNNGNRCNYEMSIIFEYQIVLSFIYKVRNQLKNRLKKDFHFREIINKNK